MQYLNKKRIYLKILTKYFCLRYCEFSSKQNKYFLVRKDQFVEYILWVPFLFIDLGIQKVCCWPSSRISRLKNIDFVFWFRSLNRISLQQSCGSTIRRKNWHIFEMYNNNNNIIIHIFNGQNKSKHIAKRCRKYRLHWYTRQQHYFTISYFCFFFRLHI